MAVAQNANPYILNGDATKDNCHCYTLTPDEYFKHGSVWNQYKINLNQSFSFHFNVYLGCRTDSGADGIAFILQPVSTSLGSTGGGLGFEGINPSVAVTIDTWQNPNDNDPSYDHIAIQTNGITDHSAGSDLDGPVTVLPNEDNIEDCKWHVLYVQWDAVQKILKASVDGQPRVLAQNDLVQNFFKGDSMVYWGFTASTGGARNLQRFCTSLDARFKSISESKQCLGTPINFTDSSTSFGTIKNWYWDLGDGTTTTVTSPGDHLYAKAGEYPVKLVITGNDGCQSDTFEQNIIVGTYPVPGFKNNIGCTGREIFLQDTSTNKVGNINQWYWTIDDNTISTEQSLAISFNQPGTHTLTLAVNTGQHCNSDTVKKIIAVNTTPEITAQFENNCFGYPTKFAASQLTNYPDLKWHWDFGDNNIDSIVDPIHLYTTSGIFNASVFAQANNGCWSDTLNDSVHIIQIFAFAGNDTVAAIGQPIQLQASGGTEYDWFPSAELNDPFISNPIAILQRDTTYYLTVSDSTGCIGKDTLHIKVYRGPTFYVPTAFTPNEDGRNDLFRPFPVGISHLYFFKVFNRWGKEVFATKNLWDGWDGNENGKPAPVGAYVWMLQGKDYTGKIISQQGTVTLIR